LVRSGLVEQARLRQVDRPICIACPQRMLRKDHRGGIFLEQLATDYENRLRSALAWSRAVVVITEIGGRTPAMQLRNIVELLLQWIFAQTLAVDEAAHVPELAEIAAALVGRIAAPQQFAGELVIEADHLGLD